MADSGVIDTPHIDGSLGSTTEDFKKIKVRNKSYSSKTILGEVSTELKKSTIESQQINISSANKTLNSTIKTSKDGDNANSRPSSQTHSFPETATAPESVEETETNKDDLAEHFEYEFDQYNFEPAYTSLTTQYDADTDDNYYQQPFSSLIQEESSLLLSPSYNFSGLQVTQLTETPRVWDSQQQFLEQVGLKLYMFVPAIVAGSLLSISFWILAMIILRTYGLIRTKIFPHDKNEDLEMCPSNDVKEKCQKDSPSTLQSKEFSVIATNQRVSSLSRQCDCKPNKLLKNTFEEKLSSSSHSFHSSPVSLSSGIGVSERGSGDERDGDRDSRDSSSRDSVCDHHHDSQGHSHCRRCRRWSEKHSEHENIPPECKNHRQR